MDINLIDYFMNFKKRNVLAYCNVIFPISLDEVIKEEILNKYIDTYINCYYYKILGTLDEKNVSKYDFNVILKELEGYSLELLSEIDKENELYYTTTHLIRYGLYVALIGVLIDINDFSLCLNDTEYETEIMEIINLYKEVSITNNSQVVSQLVALVKSSKIKEKKFFNNFDDDNFSLCYKPYRHFEKIILVDMKYKIPKLSRNYRTKSIDNVYNSIELMPLKVKTILTYLNVDILKKILKQSELETYLVNLPEYFLKQKDIFKSFLNFINNNYIKKHIVLLINNKDYISHKSLLEGFKDKYLFALIIDISHINDVEKKLSSLEDSLFNYIILDKIKEKDYDIIKKYKETSLKTIIINEFICDVVEEVL
ncbi:MAG: hypothetical protein RSC85_00210 [Bacilli bacterium]